jgi:esterase/lipase superfamily enzyme
MNERVIKWYTPYLSREFEMLAFGNAGGLPLILFPTSFGRYYQNKDFGLVDSVSGYVGCFAGFLDYASLRSE